MFKGYEITLHRVHDTVTIKEGDDKLTLHVDSDPMRMVAGLEQARKRMQTMDDESTEQQRQDAAIFFSAVIFGREQAERLLDFYHGDPACVINICGQYFKGRLAGLIEKAQKKMT